MLISANDSQKNTRGFTLVEALVALAVLSLATAIAAGAVNARSPRLALDRTADQLVVDLKRARLIAEIGGKAVVIEVKANGYRASAADIAREFPIGLTADWGKGDPTHLILAHGLKQQGATIRLSKGKEASVVTIAPVSGRIVRER